MEWYFEFSTLWLDRCYMWELKIWIVGGWILNVLISLVNFILMSDKKILFNGEIEWFILCYYMSLMWVF